MFARRGQNPPPGAPDRTYYIIYQYTAGTAHLTNYDTCHARNTSRHSTSKNRVKCLIIRTATRDDETTFLIDTVLYEHGHSVSKRRSSLRRVICARLLRVHVVDLPITNRG